MGDDIFGARWLNDRPREPEVQRPNRFADAKNVTDLMYRVVGAAGARGNDQVFNVAAAIEIADQAIDRLIELGWARQDYVITTGTSTRT